jgi:H+/Cl- antiporter ClcA
VARDAKFSGTKDAEVNLLSGMASAYGGLLSSPVITVMLILEVTRPGGDRFTKTITSAIVSSSVGFGIHFAIAGAVFLDVYKVPQYKFEDWELLVAIPLGLFAAVVVTVLVVSIHCACACSGECRSSCGRPSAV